MIELKPPLRSQQKTRMSIFLAGSIEMGTAEDWQARLTKMLEPLDVTVCNPRRDDWDPTWKQSIDNPPFVEQVEWELDHIESCDLVVMYFDPNTKSPITLLELGILSQLAHLKKQVVVCCPEGFWRKGNVDVVCKRYRITCVDTFDDFVMQIGIRLLHV